MKSLILSAIVAALGVSGGNAATYNFSWDGAGGYSMEGQFTFANELVGTGVITQKSITDLAISIFQNGVSLGTRSLSGNGMGSRPSEFNLNFDTNTEKFLLGGLSSSSTGQNWFTSTGGSYCDTIGFSSGLYSQGVCVNGTLRSNSFVNTDLAVAREILTVTRADIEVVPVERPAIVPLPAALPLLLAAIVGLGLVARRRRGFVGLSRDCG